MILNNKLVQQLFRREFSLKFLWRECTLITCEHAVVNHTVVKESSKSFRGLTIPKALVRSARRSICCHEQIENHDHHYHENHDHHYHEKTALANVNDFFCT